MFIDEYAPAGVYVQSVAMPTSGASAMTADPVGFTGGFMGRTVNGQSLLIPGYRKNVSDPGSPSIDSALSTPRVIGLVDRNENINATTALTESFSTNSFRSIASVDGTSFYVTGANVTSGQYAGQGDCVCRQPRSQHIHPAVDQ